MSKGFQQPSVMTTQEHFANAPAADIERSRFDRSHGYKTTLDSGNLVPIYIDEVLPGDTFTLNATAFARLATPLKPFMDNLFLDVHYFFVPNRLVWDNFQKFMGERIDPDDDPNIYSVPQIQIPISTTAPTAADIDLAHAFGLPYVESAGGSNTLEVNALPFRAYNLIYNEWYRDQNLQDSVAVPKGDGPDLAGSDIEIGFLRRNKRHDYFTSCLPWPQKGDPVVIPLGERAEVEFDGEYPDRLIARNTSGVDRGFVASTSTGDEVRMMDGAYTGTGAKLFANLADATAVTINSLREAVQMQAFLEADARGGTRYIELILQHFRVRSSDSRLQRPEFIGGGSTRININPIAATATDASIPQGNLAAIGTAVGKAGFQKAFEEHGFVIGIASIRADLTYQRGVERMWLRKSRYDYYWPEFAHLGEQSVFNKELFYTGDPVVDNQTFGYQERYAEYRYKPSRITGLFNSDARGGTRYIELILQHFRVRSSDSRLQRPEFIGGGSTRININPIAATATDASIPQGNLAAIGTAVGKAGFQKAFEEHGFVIGIASIRADLTYQRGVERMWLRKSRYDYYWPEFAHLGEQSVFNKELFYTGDPVVDNQTFGYQERYAEYRYKPSRITGLFNSDAAASLDFWHLSQDFGSLPALNSNFIEENPPVDRVIAVPSEPQFLMDVWFNLKCDRPMPTYSVPGLGSTL